MSSNPLRAGLLLATLFTGCAPPAEIACMGPLPFTCESSCVTFCLSSETDDAGVFYVARDKSCVPSCWSRPDGGAR